MRACRYGSGIKRKKKKSEKGRLRPPASSNYRAECSLAGRTTGLIRTPLYQIGLHLHTPPHYAPNTHSEYNRTHTHTPDAARVIFNLITRVPIRPNAHRPEGGVAKLPNKSYTVIFFWCFESSLRLSLCSSYAVTFRSVPKACSYRHPTESSSKHSKPRKFSVYKTLTSDPEQINKPNNTNK